MAAADDETTEFAASPRLSDDAPRANAGRYAAAVLYLPDPSAPTGFTSHTVPKTPQPAAKGRTAGFRLPDGRTK